MTDAKTAEKQRDALLDAVLNYIDAKNSHVVTVEFEDVQRAIEQLRRVAFEIEHELRKHSDPHESRIR